MRKRRPWVFVLGILMLLSGSTFGQVATTGKIAGMVTDSSGAAVPNATVTVKSTSLMAERTTGTGADGAYLFDLLPLATYEVTVAAKGFKGFSETGIVLTAGFTATVNAKLQVGEVTQVVRVEGVNVVDLQGVQTSTRSEEHTSELQSPVHLVCRLLLEKKKVPSTLLPRALVGRCDSRAHALTCGLGLP